MENFIAWQVTGVYLVCTLIAFHNNMLTGHNAFLGFFYLDYAYNNAVVHVFIEVLKESLEDNPNTPSSAGGSDVETGSSR